MPSRWLVDHGNNRLLSGQGFLIVYNKKNLDIEKLEMKISDHYKLESANNSEKRHQEVEELFDFLNW